MTTVRLGTRGSALALWQSRFVAAQLALLDPGLHVELVEIVSTGDQITDVLLQDVEGTGFFTATLERALLDGRVDVAAHSYKDLPVEPTAGLTVAAVPARGPVEDVLCARDGHTLRTLPPGARVGTCSARRTAQVRARRPDLEMRPLRGNVPTRVRQVTTGALDAIVLARAGMVRLGLDRHVSEVFTLEAMLPAPAQGALAVECRTADHALVRLLAGLDDPATRRAVTAERVLLHALGGGCSVPVGAAARLVAGQIVLDAGVFSLDGSRALRVTARGHDGDELGRRAAGHLLDQGAREVLRAFEKTPRVASAFTSGAPS